MFDLLDRAALRVADDAEVRAAIAAAARAEAMVAAAKFDAIAELTRRLARDSADEETGLWLIDGWAVTAAEVGAAMGVSGKRASAQMHLARDLDQRLPQVAALLRAGIISERVAAVMAWRTKLVCDELLELIDSELAAVAQSWGPLSDSALKAAVDAVLAEHDPDAVREYHDAVRGLDIQFGKPDDATGTASVFGRVLATTQALLEAGITELLAGVCKDDPRTNGQLRVAALEVIAARGDRLACQCGAVTCTNSAPNRHQRGSVIVHVIAEQAAVAEAQAMLAGGAPTATPDPDPVPPARPSLIMGTGLIPTGLLAELLRCGATLTPLAPPNLDGAAQRRYRPSPRLDRFIRLRDMTCRFPGCNTPADRCDIDHAVPHPAGPTHPDNLRCLCRKHHLLRTFWLGWTDRQHPDGTIEWTSPTGGHYTTKPGAALLFPDWGYHSRYAGRSVRPTAPTVPTPWPQDAQAPPHPSQRRSPTTQNRTPKQPRRQYRIRRPPRGALGSARRSGPLTRIS